MKRNNINPIPLFTFLLSIIFFLGFTQNISADVEQDKRKIGIYIEWCYSGGFSTAGVGFTFLNEMLKLQVNYFPHVPAGSISDISGWALGTKMIVSYNLSYYETFLTTSIGPGVGFTYFFMNKHYFVPSVFLQWEFISIDMSYLFQNWKYFSTFSLFTEPQFYFIRNNESWHTPFALGLGFRTSIF
jgi:hypothetical protein